MTLLKKVKAMLGYAPPQNGHRPDEPQPNGTDEKLQEAWESLERLRQRIALAERQRRQK